MSKENFSWKSLFIVESKETPTSTNEIPNVTPPPTINRFPDEKIPPVKTMPQSNVNNPFLGEILEVYEKGLSSLNLPDFDFFELYKSVIAVGVTSPQSYQMAFTMGKTIKSDLTKEQLLEKSTFYISEIEKVFARYDATGKAKKQELDSTIAKGKIELANSISDLEKQIAELQRELELKRLEISKLETNNGNLYAEINLKIEANNYAKNKILDSINLVVSGINQYL